MHCYILTCYEVGASQYRVVHVQARHGVITFAISAPPSNCYHLIYKPLFVYLNLHGLDICGSASRPQIANGADVLQDLAPGSSARSSTTSCASCAKSDLNA